MSGSETTPRDFAIGKRLCNLPALREVGFQANQRRLDVERLSHDCAIGEDAFQRRNQPVIVGQQRASALRFADPCAQVILSLLVMFRLLPEGFFNADVREPLAQLLGLDPSLMTPGRMTYHLRRLRLHGLIVRLPGRHRYRVTDAGFRLALFCSPTYGRILRPGLSHLHPHSVPDNSSLARRFMQLEAAVNHSVAQAALAA